jgi:hypothetical protein
MIIRLCRCSCRFEQCIAVSYMLSDCYFKENYLKALPNKVKNLDGPPKILKHLELMDKAASSISDGDLIDSLIHGYDICSDFKSSYVIA